MPLKRWFIVIFGLICAVGSWSAVSPATAQSAIKLSVVAGFDGLFRADRWVPVMVMVSNNGPDLSGELRVTSSGTGGLAAGAFSTPIDLPNGSNKRIFLYLNAGFAAQQIKVELANSTGILADDTQPLHALTQSDLLIGVVTESPRGTLDLQSLRTGIGDSRQVNWQIENIPDNPEALRALD